jgi:hypothetical protein
MKAGVDFICQEAMDRVNGGMATLRQLPKQWQWKNAYHCFEHALVGYIVAQQLQGEMVTLYYAFPAIRRPPLYWRQMSRDGRRRRSRSATFTDVQAHAVKTISMVDKPSPLNGSDWTIDDR